MFLFCFVIIIRFITSFFMCNEILCNYRDTDLFTCGKNKQFAYSCLEATINFSSCLTNSTWFPLAGNLRWLSLLTAHAPDDAADDNEYFTRVLPLSVVLIIKIRYHPNIPSLCHYPKLMMSFVSRRKLN